MAAIQKQESGISKEAYRELSISEAIFSKWQAKYGGMQASEIKRLKNMEAALSLP